jgi:tol-pal system protein YbgF
MGLIWGCTPQADMQQMQSNQFALRGMIANDRQQIEALQVRVKRLSDQIAEIRHGGTAGASSNNGQTAALNDRVTKLEAEVAALQAGAAAAAGPAAGAPAAGGPVGAPEPAVAAVTPPSAAAPPPPAMPSGPEWKSQLDGEIGAARKTAQPGAKLYRAGLDAMRESKYALAMARFAELQHKYPKSELTEPAEYFAANALYETGKFDQSILQFNDLVMRFPKGRFASAALLREAQAFLKLNDRIDARLTLQKLVSDHSQAPEAPIANAMLKNMAND